MKLDIQLFATINTTFSESNISIENNTSSLTITIYFSADNSQTWFASKTLYCNCNDQVQSKNVRLDKGGHVQESFTFNNIQHNTDGTKSVQWSWDITTGTSVLGTIERSGTRTLTAIPRASTPTFSSNPTELNQSVTITTNRAVNTFTHTITYSIGSSSGTIAENVGDSTTWTPPLSLANEITTSTSGDCIITCTTYNGDTLIGTKQVVLGLTIPSSIVPSVSIGTLTEASDVMIALGWNVFVQNKSKLNIPITASGSYGSTITSIITTINGLNFSGSNVTTSTLVTAGTNTISTTATDSRGRTATTTTTYNVIAYSNPSITSAQVQRCLQDGTLSEDGTYLLYTFVGTISPVSNNNYTSFKIGRKLTTDDNYTYVTISSNYSVNAQDQVSTFTISPDYPYDIIFEAEDSFMTTSINRTIDTGFDLMNFNANGKAMAIGKVSEATGNQELFEIDLPIQMTQTISSNTSITATNFIGAWESYTNDIATQNTTSNNYLVVDSNDHIQYKEVIGYGIEYSTTEHVIGKWKDGSTLYAQTINTSTSAGNNDIAMPNGITIRNVYGLTTQSSGNLTPIAYYSSSTDWCNFFYRASMNQLVVRCGSSAGYGDAEITIEYTKNS